MDWILVGPSIDTLHKFLREKKQKLHYAEYIHLSSSLNLISLDFLMFFLSISGSYGRMKCGDDI